MSPGRSPLVALVTPSPIREFITPGWNWIHPEIGNSFLLLVLDMEHGEGIVARSFAIKTNSTYLKNKVVSAVADFFRVSVIRVISKSGKALVPSLFSSMFLLL